GGCLELIRNGARLVRSADDVLEDLKGIAPAEYPAQEPGVRSQESDDRNRTPDLPGLTPDSGPPTPDPCPLTPDLDPPQQRVWELLAARRHADELAREAGL